MLFSATLPRWVRNVAEDYLAPTFKTIDLAQNLKNKTSKTVNHLAINCPYHNRLAALADICKNASKSSTSNMLWRLGLNNSILFN